MAGLLLDTHILLWAAFDATKLSPAALLHRADESNALYFSPITIWEATIKFLRNPATFEIDPRVLRHTLLANGVLDLPLRSEHPLATLALPPIQKDPFDRVLIAQANVEDFQLLTTDALMAQYQGPILQV